MLALGTADGRANASLAVRSIALYGDSDEDVIEAYELNPDVACHFLVGCVSDKKLRTLIITATICGCVMSVIRVWNSIRDDRIDTGVPCPIKRGVKGCQHIFVCHPVVFALWDEP